MCRVNIKEGCTRPVLSSAQPSMARNPKTIETAAKAKAVKGKKTKIAIAKKTGTI